MTVIAEKRKSMSFLTLLGEYYLGMRKKSLQRGVSKARIIPYAINYIQKLAITPNKIPTLCEMGCGDGIILGEIYDILKSLKLQNTVQLTGLDYNQDLIKIARKKFPKIRFTHKDLVTDSLSEFKEHFDVVLLPNVLHEVCSFYGQNKEGKFEMKRGRAVVKDTLEKIAKTVTPNGLLVIVDGVEPDNAVQKKVRFKIKNAQGRKEFDIFKSSYRPIQPQFKEIEPNVYETSLQIFTRFVTKSQFTTLPVWDMEKEETYQYFSLLEYTKLLKDLGLTLQSLDQISPDLGIWNEKFEILSEDIKFPYEFMILTAQKK